MPGAIKNFAPVEILFPRALLESWLLRVSVSFLLLPRRLRRLRVGIFLLEALHAASSIQQLLFAGEKWMAARANFHAQHVAFDRRARLKRASARAVHQHFVIIGMDTGFHEGTFLADRSASRHTQPDVARSTETFRLRDSPQRCKAAPWFARLERAPRMFFVSGHLALASAAQLHS